MTTKYLNPMLYNALVAATRKGLANGGLYGQVRVKRPGVATSTRIARKQGRLVREVVRGGEEYNVCCPACGDKRYRLYINHLWGQFDPRTKDKNFGLINCYNEHCQSTPGFSASLLTRLGLRAGQVMPVESTAAPEAQEFEGPPGRLVGLDRLEQDHPALLLLRDRWGFDPSWAGSTYGVQYCVTGHPNAARRLAFPLDDCTSVEPDAVGGYQFRYVGTGDGDCKGKFSTLGDRKLPILKWWTSTGYAKSAHLYNAYRAARAYERGGPVIITEGIRDVMAIGNRDDRLAAGPSVAVFGSSMSMEQQQLLRRLFPDAVPVLAFDPDVWQSPSGRDRMHRLEAELRVSFDRVASLGKYLQEIGGDPGDTPHEVLWHAVDLAMREAVA